MEENFATRLKLFIDTNGLTPSQFADMCGIPRPTLSQVLSGRNKKISDALVKQIHTAFPDLSVLWILFGEGPVKVSSNPALGNGSTISGRPSAGREAMSPALGSNFDNENSAELHEPSSERIYSNLEALNNANQEANAAKNQIFESDLKIMDLQRQIENMRQNPRKVIQITIYYDDSTFETFVPK